MKKNVSPWILTISVPFLTGLMLSACAPKELSIATAASRANAKSLHHLTQKTARQWHSGGTLHFGNVRDWQRATFENKRATCADYLMALSEEKLLRADVSVQSYDHKNLLSNAELLVKKLNENFQNISHKQLKNTTVDKTMIASEVLHVSAQLGWLKKS
jgi:hypothetical protein